MEETKKILILGGKPIGSCELVETAKRKGLYTIVTDYLDKANSPAKRIADESWDISTADIENLSKKIDEEKVSAITTGVHEFNIGKMIDLCTLKNFPQYCNRKQWNICENKKKFKQLCQKFEIDVAKCYTNEDLNNNRIEYPVIVKPVDSSGSRGFSICNNYEELHKGIEFAQKFSNEYLIEEYVKHEACIIHYTAINGEIYFSGMSDKHSQILNDGASVMAIQTFPSQEINMYLEKINNKAIKMFKSIGIKNGPIWIEAFNDLNKERFLFNEMGFRLGGSMTNYPVKHFYGIDQLELIVDSALGQVYKFDNKNWIIPTKKYCILPIHLRKGKIKEIKNLKEIEKIKNVNKVVLVHNINDEIQNWGTAQQVFCYLHVKYNENVELTNCLNEVKRLLKVLDENNENMLFYLFDLSKLNVE